MKRFGNLSVRRKKKSDVHCIQTHTLGAAEAAAEAVTSLLGRRVTNELEHIVLALEMSRGVKMSPQIASGHQMSPFHSTSPSLPSAKSVFVPPPLSDLPLLLSLSLFHLLTSFQHSALSSLASSTTLSPFSTAFLFIPSKGGRGRECREKEFVSLTQLLSSGFPSSLAFSYIPRILPSFSVQFTYTCMFIHISIFLRG